jgi:hypothetical protein
VPYGASTKIGLQFKRRFWEEDEQIYGGITYTDLPIWQVGYANTSYGSSGKGVLLGAYVFDSPYAYEFTALPPEDRLKKAVEYGAQIHPQAVGWHRFPGCSAVSAGGPRKRASSITRICAPPTGESPSLVNTSPIFRHGRRAPFCPRSTRSRGYTGGWWLADRVTRTSSEDRGPVAGRGARDVASRSDHIGCRCPVIRRLFQ